jgi:hypothetical protein
MKFTEAITILEIEIDSFDLMTKEELKKKYHKMAIKYHPDKNHSQEATQRFQEVSHSYLFLLNKIQNNDKEDENEEECKNYKEVIYLIIEKLLKKENLNEPLSNYIKHIISIIGDVCENKVQPIIEKIKLNKMQMYYSPKEMETEMETETETEMETETETEMETKRIILNPNLKDLFENNLYKLNENGLICIVPLWHNELIYENENITVLVNCIPVLPPNIQLDEENNIHLILNYNIKDIFEKQTHIIEIKNEKGECIKTCIINLFDLRLVKEQVIIIENEGISKININDIYDISNKSNIILHITLTLE